MIDLDDDAPLLPKKRFPGYNHAELVATVALEIREFLGKFPDLNCELGFESGSAVGGLIGDGTSGLQFCLFGHIVNLAKSFSTLVSHKLLSKFRGIFNQLFFCIKGKRNKIWSEFFQAT